MKRHKIIFTRLATILLILVSLTNYAQPALLVKPVDLNKLPQGVRYEGKVKSSSRWTDAKGDNIVLLTETGIYKSKNQDQYNDGVNAALNAYHYIINSDTSKQTWKVHDYVMDCPVDIEASYIKNTFQITDLDSNGIAEIWLMYKKVCHGDISPSEMKIIMYEGQQKFAMRGESKVYGGTDDKGKDHYIGGEYTFDKAFADGPKAFLQFAKKLWKQYIMQTGE